MRQGMHIIYTPYTHKEMHTVCRADDTVMELTHAHNDIQIDTQPAPKAHDTPTDD